MTPAEKIIFAIGATALLASAILGAGIGIIEWMDRRAAKKARNDYHAERRRTYSNVVPLKAREVPVEDEPLHFVPRSVLDAREAADEKRHIEWVMTNYPLGKDQVLLPPDSLAGQILNFRQN